jgi:hypothetical protein
MARQSPKLRAGLLGVVVALAGAVFSQAALAEQNCGEDVQKLAQRREAEMARINGFVQAAHGKKLDPAQFCSQSAGLGAAENALIAYMVKNKDWCSIPDEAIANLKAAHAKSAGFTAKACAVAAQIRKLKQQQASGGGANSAPQAQPLPAGPL